MQKSDQMWVLGDSYTFHLSTPELAVVEIELGRDSGPPLHSHKNEDETLYVLSGVVEVNIENTFSTVASGNFLHFPKGCLHTFRAVSKGGARILVTISPGSLAQLFREIGVSSAEEATDTVRLDQAREKLFALSEKFGLHIPAPAGAGEQTSRSEEVLINTPSTAKEPSS